MVKKTVSLSFEAVLLKWGDDVHSTYRAHGFKSAFSCRGLFRVTRLWLYPGWGTEVPEFSFQFARTHTYVQYCWWKTLSHDLQGFIHPNGGWEWDFFHQESLESCELIPGSLPRCWRLFLLEVNSAPSLSTPTNLDEEIKEGVLMEAETDDATTFKTQEGCCKLICWFVSGNWEKNWIQLTGSASSRSTFVSTCLSHVFCDVVDVCCLILFIHLIGHGCQKWSWKTLGGSPMDMKLIWIQKIPGRHHQPSCTIHPCQSPGLWLIGLGRIWKGGDVLLFHSWRRLGFGSFGISLKNV